MNEYPKITKPHYYSKREQIFMLPLDLRKKLHEKNVILGTHAGKTTG